MPFSTRSIRCNCPKKNQGLGRSLQDLSEQGSAILEKFHKKEIGTEGRYEELYD